MVKKKRSWYFSTLQTLVLSDTFSGRRGRGKGGEGEEVGGWREVKGPAHYNCVSLFTSIKI